MKIRIRFAKYGAMRFIGHLDLMRFFQKAIRKAGIDISFSEGLSPHMIMSFAAPLGLGVCGMSEYADIAVGTPVSSSEALRRLNTVTVEGIEFLDFVEIPDGKAGKAMSLVTEADYAVRFRRGCEPEDPNWPALLERFVGQSQIPCEKETKKGVSLVDLKLMIHEVRIGEPFSESSVFAERMKSIWEMKDEEPVIFLRLAAGSAANLKPELFMEAFASFAGWNWDRFSVEIGRLELYTQDGESGRISLLDLGKTIEAAEKTG